MKIHIIFIFLLSVVIRTYSQNIQLELPLHCEVYVSKNTNGSIEKLYVPTSNRSNIIYYTHSNNPNKLIPLKVVESSQKDEHNNFILAGEGQSWVQFPNSPLRYKLESTSIALGSIICTNPDKSVQTFEADMGLAGSYGTYKKRNNNEYLYIKNIGSGKVSVKYTSEKYNFKWQSLIVENLSVSDMGALNKCSVRFPLIKEDEYYLSVEFSEKSHSYEIHLQHASQSEEPEIYYWINK